MSSNERCLPRSSLLSCSPWDSWPSALKSSRCSGIGTEDVAVLFKPLEKERGGACLEALGCRCQWPRRLGGVCHRLPQPAWKCQELAAGEDELCGLTQSLMRCSVLLGEQAHPEGDQAHPRVAHRLARHDARSKQLFAVQHMAVRCGPSDVAMICQLILSCTCQVMRFHIWCHRVLLSLYVTPPQGRGQEFPSSALPCVPRTRMIYENWSI